MELTVGFFLGIVASVLASFIFIWLTSARLRPLLSTFRSPWFQLKLLRKTPEREIATVVRQLFRAWSEKNLQAYLSCWTEDCVRIQGASSNVQENKSAIAAKFQRSCEKYLSICVRTVVIDTIKIARDGKSATAEVYYRFELTRKNDLLPAVEHSREFYSFRRKDGVWLIAANIDHFSEITP